MLKKLSTKTNFILIGIVVGLFVGVSIRQALGDTTTVPGTVRADNLTVNTSGQYENGLIVAGGNALVAGNIGVGTTTPTAKLDVVGDIKSTTQLCVGATCINESELQTIKSQTQTTTAHPGVTVIHLTKIGSGTVKLDGEEIVFQPGKTEAGMTWGAGLLPRTVSFVSVPDSGSKFVKWSGGCSGTGNTCSIDLKPDDADINVTMEFATVDTLISYNLAVIKEGTGTGTIVSAPTGIDCGSACAHTFSSGTSVTLTANKANGSVFAGWSDACTGATSCTVVMSSAKNVRATFTSGTGGGVVTPGTMTGTGTVSDPYMCPVSYSAGIQSPVDCKNDPKIKQSCCPTGTITSCKAAAGGSSLVGTGCSYNPDPPAKHIGAGVDQGPAWFATYPTSGGNSTSPREVGSFCQYGYEDWVYEQAPYTDKDGNVVSSMKIYSGNDCLDKIGTNGWCYRAEKWVQSCIN